jgi:FMN phosphatase YigB (HAD superfamily)
MPKRVRAEPREQCHAGSGGEDDPAAAADDRGHRAPTQAFLDRAELTTLVERVLSIDEARAWKPSRAPYELALRAAGVPAGRVALVAVHSSDIHGAHGAGLATGWWPRAWKASRPRRSRPPMSALPPLTLSSPR